MKKPPRNRPKKVQKDCLMESVGILATMTHLSHEKNPGWLGYIGDYMGIILPSYIGIISYPIIINHEIRIPINQPVFHGK